MTYIQDMKLLLKTCNVKTTIYEKEAIREINGNITPLTAKERRKVNSLSKEHGYRRLIVDFTEI
jgi:hypothetical protein